MLLQYPVTAVAAAGAAAFAPRSNSRLLTHTSKVFWIMWEGSALSPFPTLY